MYAPLGIPATETTKFIAWNLAFSYAKSAPKKEVPQIPPIFNLFTQADLTAAGVTFNDLLTGKENICTVNAKIYATSTAYTAATPTWDSFKTALVDNDKTLTSNDRTTNAQIARQLAWLRVTAEIGQEPRHYTDLMKITNDIRDVCNMSESDIMKLTGKSALRDSNGNLEDAKDFYGTQV